MSQFIRNKLNWNGNILLYDSMRKIRKISICTTDGFSDGKTSNVSSSPQQLSGSLLVIELGGLTDDRFDAGAHEQNWHSNCPRIIHCANRKLTINSHIWRVCKSLWEWILWFSFNFRPYKLVTFEFEKSKTFFIKQITNFDFPICLT